MELTHDHDSLTVEEVLDSKVFKSFEILGGNEGLIKRCNHMTILETPEGLNWLKGGEFLLTTGYALHNNIKGKQDMVSDAYHKGVVAIGIKENRYFNKIDKKLVEDANKYDVLLIKLPYNLVYTDTISNFYDLIFYKKNSYILNLNNVYKNLLKLSFENRDMDGIIQSLSNISDSNIFLFDDDFNILSRNIIDFDSYNNISYYFPFNNNGKRMIKNIKFFNWNYHINDSYISMYPIMKNNEPSSYLYIVSNRKLESIEQRTIKYGASMISSNLEREWMIELKQTNFNKILVETMLNSKDLTNEFYENIEKDLGWDKTGKFIGICIKVFLKKSWKELIDYNYEIYRIINNILGFNSYLTTIRSDKIFLFVKIESDIYLKNVVYDIKKELQSYEDEVLTSIGVSRTYNSLKQIEDLYNESFLASLFCEKDVVYYEGLDNIKLLYLLKEDVEVYNYYCNTIKKLEVYDNDNGTDLLGTIETYLKCNLNKKVTSSKLFIHVETLRYRLNRVQEITGYSVDNVEDTFSLQMGLKLKKILKLK